MSKIELDVRNLEVSFSTPQGSFSAVNGINFLLKNSLGGGGMASMNIDPQGKSYAQQLLEYDIPIDAKLLADLKTGV